MSEFIELKDVIKTYWGNNIEPVHALRGINLKIQDGDFIAIMGPSGCGKSTLMNIVGLLDTPTSGNYFLHGKEVKNLTGNQQSLIRRETIGFIFQGYNLLKRMPAWEQVSLPLSYIGVGASESKERSYQALKMVGLEGREKSRPNQLSGGQQQRVCIARALVSNSGLLLADEPTGALDSKTGKDLMELFRKLNQEQGKTILLITHDEQVANYAKKVIRMKDGKFIV